MPENFPCCKSGFLGDVEKYWNVNNQVLTLGATATRVFEDSGVFVLNGTGKPEDNPSQGYGPQAGLPVAPRW